MQKYAFLCTLVFIPLQASTLQIIVLQGENAKHGTLSKRATQTSIEVRDAANKPLPGAQVVFQLPASGPGGSFPGGRLSQRLTTDPRGQAATSGFVPNDQQGRFNLKVSATAGGDTATLVIAQINVEQTEADLLAKKPRKWPWVLALAGGGAAAALALTLGGDSSSSSIPTVPTGPPPAITLIPGTVTVGGPR